MTARNGEKRKETPLAMEDILKLENRPAAELVPPEIAERLAQQTIVLSSKDPNFDPREHWARVESAKGAWQRMTSEPVQSGVPGERMERFDPELLESARAARRDISPYCPPWQPYIYHPKRALAEAPRQIMRRKNGRKVRPLTVFNHDDREIFLPVGYPWHCVGRLIARTASGVTSRGTGTLVGKRTVLTAEHVVPWDDWGKGASLFFEAGYYPSAVRFLTGQPSSWVTDAWGFVHAHARKNRGPGMDIATLRLAEPLGEWLGTFGATVYNDDWENETWWTLIGYPGAVHVSGTTWTTINGEFPTRQFGISVEDDDADGSGLELEHRADVTPGNSGGPLYGNWEKGPYIIGVQSSQEESFRPVSDGTNIAAGGNAMMGLVHRALDLWG